MKKHPHLRTIGSMVAAVALVCALIAALYVFKGDELSASDEDMILVVPYDLVTDNVLTVAISSDNPPFEELEDGEYVGLDIDIVTTVAETLGLEVEFTTMQRSDIITAIAAGGQADVAISGFTVDKKSAKTIDFTDSYYTDNQTIAAIEGSGVTEENVNEALNQKNIIIAVQSGSTSESYCQENFPNAETIACDDLADAVAAMQDMRADFVCASLTDIKATLGNVYDGFDIIQLAETGEDYVMVVSQDNPELTEEINAVLAALKDAGIIDMLIEDWKQ